MTTNDPASDGIMNSLHELMQRGELVDGSTSGMITSFLLITEVITAGGEEQIKIIRSDNRAITTLGLLSAAQVLVHSMCFAGDQ